MSGLEKAELVAICIAVLISFLAAELLPKQLTLGQCFIGLAVSVFIQSLIRDLSLLALNKATKHEQQGSEPVSESCMCLESISGLVLLLIGFLFSFAFSSLVLTSPAWAVSLALFVILSAGFLLKDFVVTWRPLGIRKEKNHLNVVVKW